MRTEMIEDVMNGDIFDQLLPVFGNPRVNLPVWNEAQRMFITDEYESASGNRYYKGIRFSNRIIIVEKVGLYHTLTYIDGIEIYTFNGEKPTLIQKKEYEKTPWNEDFIREESGKMLCHYLLGMLKISTAVAMSEAQIEAQSRQLIESSYKSILDRDYMNTQLVKLLPLIASK